MEVREWSMQVYVEEHCRQSEHQVQVSIARVHLTCPRNSKEANEAGVMKRKMPGMQSELQSRGRYMQEERSYKAL